MVVGIGNTYKIRVWFSGILVSCPAPFFMHVRVLYRKGLILEVRILQPNQVAGPWSHDISGM